MSDKLPPYDPNATCPKCDSADVAATWRSDAAERVTGRIERAVSGMPYEEHIERRCDRCGYAWPEQPLDAPSPDPGAAT